MMRISLTSRSFIPLVTFLSLYLFAVSGIVIGEETLNWSFAKKIHHDMTDIEAYGKVVAGEFLDDNFQSIAVLEGKYVWVMDAPLLLDPALCLEVVDTGDIPIEATCMDALPGGAWSGESDAIITAGSDGIHVICWQHAEDPEKSGWRLNLINNAFDSVYRIYGQFDLDDDGTMEIIGVNRIGGESTIFVLRNFGAHGWELINEITLQGTVQDLVALSWLPGTTADKQLAVVREAEGLNIFDLDGNSVFDAIHLTLPQYPDSLACLEPYATDQSDMLIWIVGSGAATEEQNDQFLVRMQHDLEPEIVHLGNLDVVDVIMADFDNDGAQDPLLVNRYAAPIRLISQEIAFPEGPFFDISTKGVEFLTIDQPVPEPGIFKGVAVCDADDDGDEDVYFPFKDTEIGNFIYYFENGLTDVDDLKLEVSDMTWDTRPEANDTMELTIAGEVIVPTWATHVEIVSYAKVLNATHVNEDALERTLLPISELGAPTGFYLPLIEGSEYETFYYILLRFVRLFGNMAIEKAGPVNPVWFMPTPWNWPDLEEMEVAIHYHPEKEPVFDPPGNGSATTGPNMGPIRRPPNGTLKKL